MMKETENISLEIGSINISVINIQLAHSLGFSIFCNTDNEGIEEEISRIERDLVFLSTIENIDVEEVIRITRNSENNSESAENIMSKLGYTKDVAELILNMELTTITSGDYQNYINRLTMYKDLLTSFLSK